MASNPISDKDVKQLQGRVATLEQQIITLNTNYLNRNWSSNFTLLQPKDLGFSLVTGQQVQPFVTVSASFTLNTTTTILNTVGGPSQGGVLQELFFALTINNAATVGPNGSLIISADNFTMSQLIIPTGANQVLSVAFTNMCVKVVSTTAALFKIPNGTFQNNLVVQVAFDGTGNTIANNSVAVTAMYSKSTS